MTRPREEADDLPVFPGFREMAARRRLADDMAERRRRLGLSQTEVAAAMGTSQSAVARIERGEADVRLSTLERYAAALGQELAFGLRDRDGGRVSVGAERRPFRFGVSVWSAGSRAEWQDKARQAEGLGYGTFLVADHLAEMFPPFVALVSAAETTTDLRVGTLVLNNDLRHPVVVAREAAAVDLLTDGRLELGLGAGHMRSEYDAAGLAYDPGGTRVARLEEAVAIVDALLSGEEVTFGGDHYRVDGHRVHPLPAQRPRPPLLVGGNGRRLLALAARTADIVGLVGFGHRAGGAEVDLSHFTTAGTRAQIDHVLAVAGERAGALELNALVQAVVVTGDRRSAAEQILPRLPGLSADDVLDSPYLLLGSEDEIVEQIERGREELGVTYYVVFEPAMESLAPVVARLAGT